MPETKVHGGMSATLSRPMYTAFSMWPHSIDLESDARVWSRYMQPLNLDIMCPKHYSPSISL